MKDIIVGSSKDIDLGRKIIDGNIGRVRDTDIGYKDAFDWMKDGEAE